MARDLALAEETRLYDQARSAARFRAYQSPLSEETPAPALPQWRLTIAMKLAVVFFPERVAELEKALGSPLSTLAPRAHSGTSAIPMISKTLTFTKGTGLLSGSEDHPTIRFYATSAGNGFWVSAAMSVS
jgi:hypothetical protein